MSRIKIFLKRLPIVHYILKKGYLSKHIRRQRIINFLFQRVFGINAECRWSVNFTSRVMSPENIKIGQGVELSFLLSPGCYIQGINGISIGDKTIFGPGVKIISANHNIYDIDKMAKARPIRIGKNCWIGANAVILPGVVLGDNTIVGAGVILNRSYPDGNVMIIANRKVEKVNL